MSHEQSRFLRPYARNDNLEQEQEPFEEEPVDCHHFLVLLKDTRPTSFALLSDSVSCAFDDRKQKSKPGAISDSGSVPEIVLTDGGQPASTNRNQPGGRDAAHIGHGPGKTRRP